MCKRILTNGLTSENNLRLPYLIYRYQGYVPQLTKIGWCFDFAASTPTSLRMIQEADLIAEVSINNGTPIRYSGRDLPPSGQWRIDVNFIANEFNSVSIKWIELWQQQEVLLMEERGEVFANVSTPDLTADLNFITAGAARFDLDCDGISNLNERYGGTDPIAASTDVTNGCDRYEIVEGGEQLPSPARSETSIFKPYDTFASNNIFNLSTRHFSARSGLRKIFQFLFKSLNCGNSLYRTRL